MFTCKQCGALFLSRATYCSSACRQAAYHQRRDDGPDPGPIGEVAAKVVRLRRLSSRLEQRTNRGVRLNAAEAAEVAVVLRQVIDGLVGA